MGEIVQFIPKCVRRIQIGLGTSSAELVRLVSRSERERARLVREARAIYDGIFPPADLLGAQQDRVQGGHMAIGANATRGDRIPS
jgi:hypothetical protein